MTKVPKGWHASIPPLGFIPRFGLKNKIHKVGIHFKEVYYNHDSLDQDDWNKAWGFTFNMFGRNKKDTVMLAWKLNLKTDRVRLALYYHNRTADGHGDERIIEFDTTINRGDKIELWTILADDEVRMKLSYQDRLEKLVGYFKPPSSNWGWNIFNWFGGNMAATHPIIIKKKTFFGWI